MLEAVLLRLFHLTTSDRKSYRIFGARQTASNTIFLLDDIFLSGNDAGYGQRHNNVHTEAGQ